MDFLRSISSYAIPIIFITILTGGLCNNVKVYDVFVAGAKEGMETVFRIAPSLVGLLVAIGVFKASGALDILVYIAAPVANILKIPSEVLPLAFLRPVSGSASIAMVADLIKTNGPDSYIGRLASTMMGSTETIFYTIAVYFGAAGIRNIRYTLIAALIADVASVIASVWICTMFFGR